MNILNSLLRNFLHDKWKGKRIFLWANQKRKVILKIVFEILFNNLFQIDSWIDLTF